MIAFCLHSIRSLRRRVLFWLPSLAAMMSVPAGGLAQQPAVGLHYGSDFATSQYDAFGSWLGRKVMYRVVFLEKTSWSTIADAAIVGTSQKWVNSASGRVEVISVPMFANGDTSGFAGITQGTRDGAFRSLASKIQAAGIASKVIIRLAWEANGNWYSWSYQKDPAGFKAAYRHIVSVMRAAAPGLRFEFNISNLATRGTTGAKWTAGYPGDDVVNVISMDIYDHWNSWTTMVNGDAGLKEMRDFANAHNTPEAYAEWALVTNSNGHGDNPGFVRAMASWMAARPGKVLYQSYWNTTGGGLIYSLTSLLIPTASAEYKDLFGAPAATSNNTAPMISSIADRVIDVNGSTGAISFTVGDAQTAASSLTLIKNVSDSSLIPLSRVVLGGTGANRTVTITPVTNKTGWSTVWLKVSDGQLTRVISFVVQVTARLSFDDVGSPPIAGSHSYQGNTLIMRASGDDIYNRADDFHFGSEWLTDDAELTVKVASLSNTNGWTKAGLMFRSSGASNSAFVAVVVTPSNGVVLQWRSAAGAYAASSPRLDGSGRAPKWLRLTRSADSFFAFYSNDGTDWELVETVTVNLPDTVLAGLALVSHAPNATATAVFDEFGID